MGYDDSTVRAMLKSTARKVSETAFRHAAKQAREAANNPKVKELSASEALTRFADMIENIEMMVWSSEDEQ